MAKILLRSQQGAFDTYVKSYNPKTGELEETRNLQEAKEYKTRAGAESSARSIFEKCYLGQRTTESIFNSVIYLG